MAMTVQGVIDTILQAIPGPRDPGTVDTLKSGDGSATVTGIVTTFMATRQVLARAKELGANLVITHEPTYYEHHDNKQYLSGDPVFESKRRFIEQSGVAIWRFHDYWHRHQPDGIVTGLVGKLGWERYQDRQRQVLCVIPRTSLRELSAMLAHKLGIGCIRVTGDADMPCSGIAFSVGAGAWSHHRELLGWEQTDVLVIGESHEWETCEYVRDSAAAGLNKALVTLGHRNSEEPGMEYLAEWLRARLPAGLPITFVPAGDPFWYMR